MLAIHFESGKYAYWSSVVADDINATILKHRESMINHGSEFNERLVNHAGFVSTMQQNTILHELEDKTRKEMCALSHYGSVLCLELDYIVLCLVYGDREWLTTIAYPILERYGKQAAMIFTAQQVEKYINYYTHKEA